MVIFRVAKDHATKLHSSGVESSNQERKYEFHLQKTPINCSLSKWNSVFFPSLRLS